MGMNVGKKTALNAEINVTPLADVMLVLLIIIILIAPMLQKGVDVEMPQAANTVQKTDNDSQTVLHVTADGRFYVEGIQVRQEELLTSLQSALARKFEKIVLIKGDQDAPYSDVMEILDRLQRSGIEDIGLVTERKLRGSAGGN